jgi:hypothetical protein
MATGAPRLPAIALDVLRHAVPLVPFYLLRGNIPNYLLLTAFDLSLGLMLIVGTTRDVRDPTTVDPRAAWLISRLTAGLGAGRFSRTGGRSPDDTAGHPRIHFWFGYRDELALAGFASGLLDFGRPYDVSDRGAGSA